MDIRKTSKAPETNIVKAGHTSNGSFGNDPSLKVKGSRTARDLSIPMAKK